VKNKGVDIKNKILIVFRTGSNLSRGQHLDNFKNQDGNCSGAMVWEKS
jgi:hypothetical protein